MRYSHPAVNFARSCAVLSMALAIWLSALLDACGQSSDPPSSVSYALKYKSPQRVLEIFQPLVEDAPDVQIASDDSKSRILLTAPPWAHSLMEQVLERVDKPQPATSDSSARLLPPQLRPLSHPELPGASGQTPAASGASADPNREPTSLPKDPRGGVSSDNEVRRRLVTLPRGQAAAMRRDLLQLLGEKLQVTTDPNAPWTLATPTGTLKIDFDLAREDVLLDGPATLVEQFSRLLTVLARRYASPAQTNQNEERVLLLRREAQVDVEQFLHSARLIAAQSFNVLPAGTRRSPSLIARLAATGQQTSPSNNPSEPAASPIPTNQNQTPPGVDPSLPQLDGVEVELLPDLDAIILKGRDQDLSQLAEIIQQLEQISRDTQPAVELIPLEHVSSTRIAELITATQTDLIGTRQGRAAITPLGKPNAVLLVGWGEAVSTLRELIRKLDQPIAAASQFQVFRLKYANATTLQQTIQSFFSNRDGELSPSIQTTVDQRTNSLIVHAAPRDMAEVERLLEGLDTPSGRAIQRTRVFEIQYSLAADVADTLRQTLQPTTTGAASTAMELLLQRSGQEEAIVSGILEKIQVTVDPRKNTLIITAPAESFAVIEALIAQLDSPGTTAKIKIFPVKNSDAASLVETLRALLPSQAGATPTPGSQLSSAPGETSLAPLRFTVDVRSNSIIATGSEGDLKIVDALVTRLDESDSMQRQNTVYQLKNSPAVDVALAINEFLRNTRQVENATPGTVNPYEQLEREVVVVPEPVSNKLIVSATPRYFEEISKMIEKLDAQPPQVMIQALIAEIALDDNEEFGVELGIQDSVLFDRSLLGDLLTVTSTTQNSTQNGIQTNTTDSIVAATNEPGFNFNNTQPLGNSGSAQALRGANDVGGQAISNFAVGRGNAELGFGGLVLSASSQNLSVLLRALEETRRMEVLSRPQVLTLDNQPAFIQVGQRVPRITGSSINQIGQQNTVELENVGLILGVTPRISPEGTVTMEIDAEKSSIGPESEGIPVSVSNDGTIIRSPRVDVTSAQATVSAADGETIILGGLITKNRREVHRKVPYLGDIPILRNLFRYDSMAVRRTELLIILTPHIVRGQADVERLKQIEMARMSWCAADVFDLHGEVYQSPEASIMFSEGDDSVEVIYPHIDPRGSGLAPAPSGSLMEPQNIPSTPLRETSESLPAPRSVIRSAPESVPLEAPTTSFKPAAR